MKNRRESVLKPFEDNLEYMNDRIKNGIESNRKGMANLDICDIHGNPVSNARVEIKQKNHEFKHGANLFMLEEFENEKKNKLYEQYFKNVFNIATLPFYWNDLEPVEGQPRFSKDSPKVYRRPAPDLCLEFCENNGITPKAHCLMYEQFVPEWLKGHSVDGVKQRLDRRFRELAERYSKRIHQWEVTNETLVLEGGRTLFNDEPDLVEWSFKFAEKYFPLNNLMINETHHKIWDCFNGNRSQYYMQIERAIGKGARIESIGMQYHMFFRAEEEAKETAIYYDPVQIYKVLDRYADFKLPIHITELTIPCYTASTEDEDIQAEIIKNIYSMWFSHEAMEGIVYWNLVDGYAAFAKQGDMTSGENYYHGGLMRFDLTPKPSYKVIQKLFGEEWRTNETVYSNDYGKTSFKGFYGEYELEITCNGKTEKRSIYLSKKGGKDFRMTI